MKMQPFLCLYQIIFFCLKKFFKLCSFNDQSFYQVHPMNMYFIEEGMFVLCKKFEINCMTLCIPFDSRKKKVL
jgi:hypothetical protein